MNELVNEACIVEPLDPVEIPNGKRVQRFRVWIVEDGHLEGIRDRLWGGVWLRLERLDDRVELPLEFCPLRDLHAFHRLVRDNAERLAAAVEHQAHRVDR